MSGTCDAADLRPRLYSYQPTAGTAAGKAQPEPCLGEWYCEIADGPQKGERCPQGKCRLGGTEHDRRPCPTRGTLHASPPLLANRKGSTEAVRAKLEDLVKTMHAAALAGTLDDGELAHLHDLHHWLQDLLAEKHGATP